MVKVRAKEKFEHTLDATTGAFRHRGEEWFVTEDRAKLLFDNGYVEIVEEEIVPEEPKDYIEELEKPKKRGRKKKS